MGHSQSKANEVQEFSLEGKLNSDGDIFINTGLGHDRQTEVRYDGSDQVTIGTRCHLDLLGKTTSQKSHMDFFKLLGVVVKTHGNRFSRNANLVVMDYYRFQGGKEFQRNRRSSLKGPTDSEFEAGPAERSRALRVGDSLYAINGSILVNKSKGQVTRIIQNLIDEKKFPIILTWKHHNFAKHISWEEEEALPPPEGEFYAPPNDYGQVKNAKCSSVSI